MHSENKVTGIGQLFILQFSKAKFHFMEPNKITCFYLNTVLRNLIKKWALENYITLSNKLKSWFE